MTTASNATPADWLKGAGWEWSRHFGAYVDPTGHYVTTVGGPADGLQMKVYRVDVNRSEPVYLGWSATLAGVELLTGARTLEEPEDLEAAGQRARIAERAAAELDALAALQQARRSLSRARRSLSRARLELGRAHGPADGMTAWADSMVEQIDLLIRQCER